MPVIPDISEEKSKSSSPKPIFDVNKESRSFFHFGAKNRPHFKKEETGGEDAFLASNNLLVVADGVGSWASQGIDSGIYSKSLVVDIKK